MYDYNPYEPFSQEMLRVISLLMLRKSNYNTNLAAGFPIQEAIVNNTEQRRFFSCMSSLC
jgi:hypothetical protein